MFLEIPNQACEVLSSHDHDALSSAIRSQGRGTVNFWITGRVRHSLGPSLGAEHVLSDNV